MRADFYGLWVAKDRKAVYIERVEGTILVSVSSSIKAPYYPDCNSPYFSSPEAMPAKWIEKHRLPYLMAEGDRDSPGMGRTYLLHFAVRNENPTLYDGFHWRPPGEDDPIARIRIVPDTGAGFIDAVTYQEDEGEIPWAEPFHPLAKAPTRDLATYLKYHPTRQPPG